MFYCYAHSSKPEWWHLDHRVGCDISVSCVISCSYFMFMHTQSARAVTSKTCYDPDGLATYPINISERKRGSFLSLGIHTFFEVLRGALEQSNWIRLAGAIFSRWRTNCLMWFYCVSFPATRTRLQMIKHYFGQQGPRITSRKPSHRRATCGGHDRCHAGTRSKKRCASFSAQCVVA